MAQSIERAIVGADFSRWQGLVPFDDCAHAGIEFGWIKAAHGLGGDPLFAANWRASRGAFRRGRGGYLWLTDQDPIAQAEHLVDALGRAGDIGELYPAVDFEEPGTKLRGEPLLVHLLQCLRRVRELAGGAVLYTGRWYYDGYVAIDHGDLVDELLTYPLWHAEYPRIEVANRRACGLSPPAIPTPTLGSAWRKAGMREAVQQFDGDGGCVLPNGVDGDFNVSTEERFARVVRRLRDTEPAPAHDDTSITLPDAPSALRPVYAPIIDADDGRAVTPIRAGEGEHEP